MTRHDEPPLSAKIPADIDRPDKILYGLTGRQLLILAATGINAMWVVLTAEGRLPFPILIAVVLPIVAAGVMLAITGRDGMSLDRYALAALAHLRRPKTQIPAGEPVQAPPSWCRMRGRLPAPLRLPVRAVREDGAMELADGRTVAIVQSGTVSFGLRTPGEQAGLIAVFGRWLNSLDAPVQILVQARPVDLSGLAGHITGHAPTLADPALEQAARDHAAFLDELGSAHDLLIRQVLIVISDTTGVQTASPSLPWLKTKRPRAARDAGASVVLRRAEEAVRSLAALGVTADVLDARACTAVLAESLSPGEALPVDNATPYEPTVARQES
ncbi:PrgI family protein [Spirillospora sp. NBC_01491]|uniref:PrgI family protein n=1 Tax=Spirillospora sp. NBC_01491 TaxID=2976007 RepID=UPI002E2EEEFC|nr:PrgI family protein [Spirillospora sp. NBC_01491]